MVQANRYFLMYQKTIVLLGCMALATVPGTAFVAARLPRSTPCPVKKNDYAKETIAAKTEFNDQTLTAVFRADNESEKQRNEKSPFANLRLAGTFVEYGDLNTSRRAVIQNTQTARQWIAGEGDVLENGVHIARIALSLVVLEDGQGRQFVLNLGLTKARQSEANQVGIVGKANEADGANSALLNPRQTGETSWVFSRSALLQYYAGLREEPERLLAVFDSLEPVYTEDRRIEGYRLAVKGESDFFEASGLRENDIVRAVNRRSLTNRRVAESMIADFIDERASAFVLDVERDGQTRQFIYQVQN